MTGHKKKWLDTKRRDWTQKEVTGHKKKWLDTKEVTGHKKK